MNFSVAAVIVTYNRKHLLVKCLNALLSQTHSLSAIFLIDNASTDGTYEILKDQGLIDITTIFYLKMEENIGGAGGFSYGLKCAHKKNYDWFWLMDDDALPELNALEELIREANNPNIIYGSIPIADEKLCWPITVNDTHINKYEDLNDITSVKGIPFLGFYINRQLIEVIGFPDESFFISGDDIEYCQRSIKLGNSIIMIKNSKIYHPMPPRIILNLCSHPFYLLIQAPWRKYYDTRNRVVIARRHYGLKLYTETLPGIFLRWLLTMRYEENIWLQSQAFFCGIRDGLLNRLGKNWVF